jgi:rfaE bifunctional protein kinase chain/domain
LSGIDIVVFVDYGKGSLARVQDLIQQCKREGKTVLVDPKGYDYEKYRGADLVKPNLDEMKVMVGGWKDEEDLANKVQEIKRRAEIRAILLTRASEGMTLYEDWSTRIYAESRELVDVSGAGETAIAAFAVAVHEGHDFYQAAKYANKAAGIAVGRFGTAVVGRDEVFTLGTCQEG